MDGGRVSTDRKALQMKAVHLVREVSKVCRLVTKFPFAQSIGASTPAGQPKDEMSELHGVCAEDLGAHDRGGPEIM
ncbi:unnamed protein product [Calypogeia fissa]